MGYVSYKTHGHMLILKDLVNRLIEMKTLLNITVSLCLCFYFQLTLLLSHLTSNMLLALLYLFREYGKHLSPTFTKNRLWLI